MVDSPPAHPYGIRRVGSLPGGVLFTEILGAAALSELLSLLELDLPERVRQLSEGTHRAFSMSLVYGALDRDVVFFVSRDAPGYPDGIFGISMSAPSGLEEERILSFLSGKPQ